MLTAVRRAAWAAWAGWTCKERQRSLLPGVQRLAREDRKPPSGNRRGFFFLGCDCWSAGLRPQNSTKPLHRRQTAVGTGAGDDDAGINRRRCSACTWSRVRRVAAATEFRTGCPGPRGNVRPCVRSQARIRASGALAVAESSSSSVRRTSSECACSSAIRARKSEDSSPGIMGVWLCKAKLLRGSAAVCALGRRIDTCAIMSPVWGPKGASMRSSRTAERGLGRPAAGPTST
jgi:hypothetical protein